MRIERSSSLLLVVDMQERLLAAIDGSSRAVEDAGWLGGLADYLEVPVWLTEQYPHGLGSISPMLIASLSHGVRWQKTHFNALDERDFAGALAESDRRQIVLAGAEAHICVLQTALGLLAAGYQVFWLSDITVSRRPYEATLASRRAEAAGAVAVSADMVAYEWLTRCDTPEFRQAHRQWLKQRALRS